MLRLFKWMLILLTWGVAFNLQANLKTTFNQKVKNYLRFQMEKDQTPGVVILMSSPKIGVSTLALGYAKLPPNPIKMTIDKNFRVASISKTYLAAMILKLAEQDKLKLQDPIQRYIPNLTELTNFKGIKLVTVEQLLNMTSGIPEYYDVDVDDYLSSYPYKLWSPNDAINFANDLSPKFNPGGGYEYSNTNYALLQIILNNITGKTLAQNLQEMICSPLGLKDTFADDFKMSPYTLTTTGYDTKHEKIDVSTYDDGFGIGDTFVITTASDLNKFLLALFVKKDVLSQPYLKKMLTENKYGRYGLGVEVSKIERWGKVYSHNGLVNGYQTNYFYIPKFQFTVIILTNNRAANLIEPVFVKIMYYYQKFYS